MKLNSIKLLPGVFCLLLTLHVSAQKIEIVLKEAKNYKIIPIRAGVLIAHEEKGNIVKGIREVSIDMYDRDLNKQKRTDFTISKQFSLLRHIRDSDNIYLLYTQPKSYGGSGNHPPPFFDSYFRRFTIIKYNIKTAAIDEFPGALSQTFQLSDLKVINGTVYMGGAAGITDFQQAAMIVGSIPLLFIPAVVGGRPYKPSVVTVNTNEMDAAPHQTYAREFGSGYTNITAFGVNEFDNEYNALITTHNGKGRGLIYKDLKEKRKNKPVKIKGVQDKNVYNVKMQTDDTRQIYSGMYAGYGEFFEKPFTSQGILVGMIDNSKSVFNHYLPYSKFKSIKYILSDKEEKHIQKEEKRAKTKKKKLRGTNILLSVVMHDALVLDDKIIYMGELCQPHTHIEMVTVGGMNNQVTVAMPIKDGDKRVGILVFAVDLKGNLLWENSIPIKNGTNAAEWGPKVKFSKYADSSIRVWYQDDESIKSAVFNSDSTPVLEELVSFTTAAVADTVHYKQSVLKDIISGQQDELYFESTIEHWYGENFIEYGEQLIPGKTSKAVELRKKRRVLYLQKIDAG